MLPGDYEAFFRAEVRCWVDWTRLVGTTTDIEVQLVVGPDRLGALNSVWYVAADGGFGDWRDRTAQRVTLAEAARRKLVPDPSRSGVIASMREAMVAATDPPSLVLPVIQGGGRTGIVIDGTHRSIAALTSGRDLRAVLVVAHVPVDPRILPDFLHGAGPELSKEEWGLAVAELDRHFSD